MTIQEALNISLYLNYLINMKIEDIHTIADIEEFFIKPKITESQHLEYKSIVKNQPGDLTKAVVAFANASGGLIIIGVKESNNHFAEKVVPFGLKSFQHTIEDHILNHVQPKFLKYKIKPFVDDNNPVNGIFVVEIEKGSNGPYMNSEKIHYIRRDKKSEPMTADEIRSAIFKGGLYDALIMELKENKQLILDFESNFGKIADKYKEIPSEKARKIQAIIFPFKTEAWKSITYSGMLSIIKKNTPQLIELYQSFSQVNHVIQAVNLGHREIITTYNKTPSHYILQLIYQMNSLDIKDKLNQILIELENI